MGARMNFPLLIDVTKFITCLLCGGLLLGCDALQETQHEPNHDASLLSVYRDPYGTPHVFADNNYGVYYGYGYVVASDRLFQMEMLKRTTEGRVAQVLGEKYLTLDKHIRTSYDHRAVIQQLRDIEKKDLDILQAYADGFNDRMDEVLDDKKKWLPAEFKEYDFLPEHWSAYDVAMIFVGSIAHRYSDFNSELDNLALLDHLEKRHGSKKALKIFNASKWLLDRHSPTTVKSGTASRDTASSDTASRDAASRTQAAPAASYINKLDAPFLTRRVVIDNHGRFIGTTDVDTIAGIFKQRIVEDGFSFSPEFTPASNYWALGKGRVSDANGVLVNGPQFGFGLPSYVYGIGLHGGEFNVVGNTLLGLPTLLFAHNNSIGWGSTAGLSDQVDVYVESLHPMHDDQYLHHGKYQTFESWQETIEVKGAEPVSVTAQRSVHGMVQQWDQQRRKAYTRARAWEGGELASMFAWINLSKSQTLDSARQNIASVATNINFYTMDTQGTLAYIHAGRYPKRKKGQDSRLPTPGTGEWDWLGMRPFTDNPTVIGGHQDSIVNWNNRPASDWISSDLWTYTWGRGDRSQFIFDELESKPSMNIEQVWEVNRRISSRDVSAPFLLPYLSNAFADVQKSEIVAKALAELKQWDQHWHVDSQGNFAAAPTIMETWLKTLLRAVFFDDIGEEFFHLYSATNNPNHTLGASMGTGAGTKALIRNLDTLQRGTSPDYDFFNGTDPNEILRATFIAALTLLQNEMLQNELLQNEMLQNDQSKPLQQWTLPAKALQWKPYNFRGVPQASESKQNPIQLPSYLNRGSENNLFIAGESGMTAFDVIAPGQSGFIGPSGARSEHYNDQLEMYHQFKYKIVPFSKAEVEKTAISVKLINYKR
jgi:penicillin G amidase